MIQKSGDLKGRMAFVLQTYFLIGDRDGMRIVKEMLTVKDKDGNSINSLIGEDFLKLKEWDKV